MHMYIEDAIVATYFAFIDRFIFSIFIDDMLP